MAVFTNVQENKFWLQLLGDLAEYMLREIPSTSEEVIGQLRGFISRFDALTSRAFQNLNAEEIARLNQDSLSETKNFRAFLLELLKMQLKENYYTGILPIVMNHFISYADLYIYLLDGFLQDKQHEIDGLGLVLYWYPVFFIFAQTIANSVSVFSEEYKQKGDAFSERFRNQYISAIYTKTTVNQGIAEFPLKDQFLGESYDYMSSFATFMVDIIFLIKENKMSSTLSLGLLDHFYRSVCYFTTQLAVLINKPKPACDPFAKRLEII